jgi:two-component system NarL family sensor kinase
MYDPKQEILIVLIAGTALFLALVISLFIFLVLYQKKNYKHILEKLSMEEAFGKEILESRLEMQEQTFLNISQEIHDNIGQILSLVRINISTIDPVSPENITSKVTNSKALLDGAIQDLRDLSKRLNSEYLSHQTLPELLKFQLDLIHRSGNFKTSFQTQGKERNFDQDQKLIIFRIAQEVLNNSIKHANAENLAITLEYLPDRSVLRISDDGIGFETNETAEKGKSGKGVGSYNLQYRANLIGGKISIESKPGQGTQAELTVPILA